MRISVFSKKALLLSFLLFFLFINRLLAQKIINGYVLDSFQEPLKGITIKSSNGIKYSNDFGYFSIQIINKIDTLYFSGIGFRDKKIIFRDTIHNNFIYVTLENELKTFDEITVRGEQEIPKVGQINLTPSQIKNLPSIFGEKDPFKSIQTLPGVSLGLEGSTNLFVRGGNAGENYVQLDDATVYNTNHLFGFFSVFNADAIKGLTFYKGAFPAQYGGRLSSVIDIRMKEGNMSKIKVDGGIGLISSRITIDGPILKNKISFLVSARRTYLDIFLKAFQSKDSRITYNFYDFNGKIKLIINPKNTIYFSSYNGKDLLSNNVTSISASSSTNFYSSFNWGNTTFTSRWNHIFGQKLFVNTSFIFSKYQSSRENRTTRKELIESSLNLNKFNSFIKENTIKTDFNYYINNRIQLDFGTWFSNYNFIPREIEFVNTFSNSAIKNQINSNSISFGSYLSSHIEIHKKINLLLGLRQVIWQAKNNNYQNFEPRITAVLKTNTKSNYSVSFTKMTQFVNQVLSTGLGLSTDLWFPSDASFKPQQAFQFSIANNRNIFNKYELSVESYIKNMKNIYSFKEGTSVFATGETEVNYDINRLITTGEGISGGVEILLKKNSGKLNGWISNTLSKTIFKFEEINEGKPFYPTHDRRFDLTIVANYQLSEKTKIASSWIFASGNILAAPNAYTWGYNLNENTMKKLQTIYGNRNAYRAQPFHRLDLTVSREKKKEKFTRTWEFGVYNAYFRKNPLFYHLSFDNSSIVLKRTYLLPIIPFISYNFFI